MTSVIEKTITVDGLMSILKMLMIATVTSSGKRFGTSPISASFHDRRTRQKIKNETSTDAASDLARPPTRLR